MELKGIDISQHNVRRGPIDWQQVYASGVRFVMIRAGWAGYAGELHFDQSAGQSLEDAAAAGLGVGLYVYSYARSRQAAQRAASEVITFARDYEVDYPIAFDIEDPLVVNYLTPTQITDTVTAFCSQVQELGYYAMFYTNKSCAQRCLQMDRLSEYDFWLAQYAPKPTYDGPFGMWQYVGNDGRCPGVTGPVDGDIAYKDYAAIIRQAGLNGFEKPEPERAITAAELKAMGYTAIIL